jgi:hypothetical protein
MPDETRTPIKLAKASYIYNNIGATKFNSSPWIPETVDRFELGKDKKWKDLVGDCRYFYKHDPIASIVINKIVDLALNNLTFRVSKGRDAAKDVIEAIKPKLMSFMKTCGLEYLISGLVIPEIQFNRVDKEELKDLGIKRFETLQLPTDMWLRDPAEVTIKEPLIGGKVSYFINIPEELRIFIENKGRYSDQSEDIELYEYLLKEMPEFIKKVKEGEQKVLLNNPLIIRYNVITGSPYPVPYLHPAIESLKHKRNLRRMDYSLASRVITAIQKITLGNDEYPLTEDNEDQLEKLKKEMLWREAADSAELERIFQIFGNHTLEIEWVIPEVTALLDEKKYKNVNSDIAMALGFPRILVTGETERSFASDPDIATVSPIQTMERIRETLLPILRKIIDIIIVDNKLGANEFSIKFKPINMMAVSVFIEGLQALYESGNLSREDYDAAFGFDLYEQLEKRKEEQDTFKELNLDEFAPIPFSKQPNKSNKRPVEKK